MPRRKKARVVPPSSSEGPTTRKTRTRASRFVDLPPPPTPRIRYDEDEEDERADSHLPPPRSQVEEEEEGSGEEEESGEEGSGEEEEEEEGSEEEEEESADEEEGVEPQAQPVGAAAVEEEEEEDDDDEEEEGSGSGSGDEDDEEEDNNQASGRSIHEDDTQPMEEEPSRGRATRSRAKAANFFLPPPTPATPVFMSGGNGSGSGSGTSTPPPPTPGGNLPIFQVPPTPGGHLPPSPPKRGPARAAKSQAAATPTPPASAVSAPPTTPASGVTPSAPATNGNKAGGPATASGTPASGTAAASASNISQTGGGITLNVDEMVQNCVYYFLINQYKKTPVKRSDLLKHAMNGQKKNFNEVMAKVETTLMDAFGMKLVGHDKGKSGYALYFITSKFVSDVAEQVAYRTPESEAKRATLHLILTVIFMLNKPLDEEAIWKLIQEMDFNKLICGKREDLQKFLKTEYVTPMYLTMEEIKDTENNPEEDDPDNLIRHRYNWGPRAEYEVSKWAILKFVAKQFPDMRPDDYDFQFNLAKEKEKDIIEAELAAAKNPAAAEAGQNGSAIRITEGADGNGEFNIETFGEGSQEEELMDEDDDGTETELEEVPNPNAPPPADADADADTEVESGGEEEDDESD